MEIQIGKKSCPTPFVFVKARRCGSNSLNNWLSENIGVENIQASPVHEVLEVF